MFQWIEDNRDFIWLWLYLICLVIAVAVLALSMGFFASKVSTSWRWTIGLGSAVVIGQIACPYFLRVLRCDYMGIRKPQVGPSRGVPSSVIGVFESLVFSVAIGVFLTESPENLAGVFAAMGLWLSAKMLAGWNRDVSIIIRDKVASERERWLEERSRGAFAAILAGALNLAIAVLGGNIAADGVVVSGGVAFIRVVSSYLVVILHKTADGGF